MTNDGDYNKNKAICQERRPSAAFHTALVFMVHPARLDLTESSPCFKVDVITLTDWGKGFALVQVEPKLCLRQAENSAAS